MGHLRDVFPLHGNRGGILPKQLTIHNMRDLAMEVLPPSDMATVDKINVRNDVKNAVLLLLDSVVCSEDRDVVVVRFSNMP